MTSYKVVTVLLCFFAVAVHSVPASTDQRSARNSIQTEDDLLDSVYADCLKKDSISCAKYKLYNVVDKMLGQKDITLADGVELVKDESAPTQTTESSRSLKGDETVESLIFDKFATFLDTHNFKIELKGKDLVETARSTARSIGDAFAEETEETDEDAVEEGRGKKKKVKKILGPLMAIAGLKMAILGKIALAVIALIAGKALIIGKLALVLSAIIGLKKLFGSGTSVTHEVVAHPHHSSSHVVSHDTSYGGSAAGYSADVGGGYGSSSHGGWQRSLDAQKLAYRGQKEA